MTTPFEILKKHELPNPLSIIQIGASGGQELEQFVEAGVEDALLLEPLDMPFGILKQRVANLPNFFPFQVLAGSCNGVIQDFYVASNGGMSSSILPPKDHLKIYPQITFNEKLSLQSFRLDAIVSHLYNQKLIRKNYAEMIYLDVQGSELSVLKGAGELLDKAKYIWTEVSTGLCYEGGVNYIEIIQFMNLFNFQLVQLELFNSLGFGDALFARYS
jgi:FkbM family methyltransferase